jgi:hypothetical protein
MRVSVTTLATWSGLHRDTIRRRLSPLLSGERGEQVDSTQALPMLYGEGERLDPAQEKAMLDKARREQAEIDLQLKRREVIALGECFHVIDAAATACREHLMSLPGRLASVYASESDAMQIERDMESEIRAALNHVVCALEAFKAKEGPTA